MDISIIIPAYNEAFRVTKTLNSISQYFAGKSYDYEIIVVNDGSSDATKKIVENLNIPHLTILTNQKNYGKGYSVKRGLLYAKGNYRLFVDADNATPIETTEILLEFARQRYDIVIGSRSINGARVVHYQPLHRRWLGILYSFLVHFIIDLREIHDTQCGFKLLSQKAAEHVLSQCTINGWTFDVEMLVIAKRLGYKIKEVPVTWKDQPKTKVKFWGMVEAIFDLLVIRKRIAENKYHR